MPLRIASCSMGPYAWNPMRVRAFRGEYMSSYSWASITEASMTQRLHIGEGQ